MAAYIVFETGHTFGPSMLYPVYRLVYLPNIFIVNYSYSQTVVVVATIQVVIAQ